MNNTLDLLKIKYKELCFISPDNFNNYVNSNSLVKYVCINGHKHQTKAKYILYDNVECKFCNIESKKLSLELNLIDKEKKICPKCLKEKNKTEFGRDKNKIDGLRRICKKCRREQDYISKDIVKRKQNSLNYLLNRPFRYLLQRAKQNHKKKGFIEDFNLDENYLIELLKAQDNKCFWSNYEINTQTIGLNDLNSMSIDRLNCDIGYIKGNIVITSKFFNIGRGNANINDFVKYLNKIFPNNTNGLEDRIEWFNKIYLALK